MADDVCSACGGDGTIHNSFGLTNRCPNCRGSGRRSEDQALFRDVTKTKPSHHHRPVAPVEEKLKRDAPSSKNGLLLAGDIRGSAQLSAENKELLIREIIEYEGIHGGCTKTFVNKMRKKLRAGDGA
ncbi:MAG: molecular chaperone DnaJ [Pseudomonadota bacterium]